MQAKNKYYAEKNEKGQHAQRVSKDVGEDEGNGLGALVGTRVGIIVGRSVGTYVGRGLG